MSAPRAEDARLPVVVVGGAGRLGSRIAAALAEDPRLRLARVLLRAGGRAAPAGLPGTTDVEAALADAALVIDASAPPRCAELAPACAARGIPYLVASTGLTAPMQAALVTAARAVPVLRAVNLAPGVEVVRQLVAAAALRLPGWDVQVVELHHRHKRDAPSGTALALGEAAGGEARGVQYAALRGGDVAGDHTVLLLGPHERIEITHRSGGGALFAAGALTAGRWLIGQRPGLYAPADLAG